MFSIIALLACGGPQETYIVPTGIQPQDPSTTEAPPPAPSPSPNIPNIPPAVGEGGNAGDLPVGVDEGCGPTSTYADKTTLTDANSSLITGTITGGTSASGPFLIDLMDLEGTQLYSIMCTQAQFEFRVPAENNMARLAFFEDADRNGPSQTDKQGLSDILTLDMKPISGLQIVLGADMVDGFNFAGNNPAPPPDSEFQNPPPPNPEDELAPGDEFAAGDERSPDAVPTDEADIPPGDESEAASGPSTAPPPVE